MSIEFPPSSFAPVDDLPWSVIASAWRGTILDLYSRAERSVDDCISALEDAGHDLGADGHHIAALARNRALKRYLDTSEFTPHAKVCSKRLGEWQMHLSRRTGLAHGVMTANREGATFVYEEHKGADGVARHECAFSMIEMIEFLRALDVNYRQLHMQLGQIKAAARQS